MSVSRKLVPFPAMTTEEKFKAAVTIIRSLPKDGPYQPSHDMMLKFYGLYKQAVEGPCTEPKPAFYEVVKGYKWRAWNSLGSMTKMEAMHTYVEELKKIIETMAYTENVANFIDALGPFYEFIDIPGKNTKINNNIKGLSDDEQPNGDSEAAKDGVSNSLMPNGHHEPKVLNGLENGSESNSDLAQSSSQDSSPRLSPVPVSEPVIVSLEEELKEAEKEEEEEKEELEDEVLVTEVKSDGEINNGLAAAAPSPRNSRAYSDSDSDEEYSEPAETPDHLVQVDPMLDDHVLSSTPSRHLSHTQASMMSMALGSVDAVTSVQPVILDQDTSANVTTFGGGDQSHPGGLQMTPRQGQQGLGSLEGVQRPSSSSLATPIHMGSCTQSSGGSGGSGGGGGGGSLGGMNVTDEINAQLIIVLRRLQTDMESVLHRLNTLETLTVSQHHHCQSGTVSNGRAERSWWPFPELSPRSTFFLLVWPLVVFGGLKLLPLIRCRRRRP